jgi:hypothetical protein
LAYAAFAGFFEHVASFAMGLFQDGEGADIQLNGHFHQKQ